MRVILNKEECRCGFLDFYKNVAMNAGIAVNDETQFDCRKICITEGAEDMIREYYAEEKSLEDSDITLLFLWFGPKPTLGEPKLYMAEIEDGFITKF